MKHTYDPAMIVTAVAGVLREAGIEPDANTEGYGNVTALAGAGMLLRGLGAFPAADPADAYKTILDNGAWEDTDNRNAEEYFIPNG